MRENGDRLQFAPLIIGCAMRVAVHPLAPGAGDDGVMPDGVGGLGQVEHGISHRG